MAIAKVGSEFLVTAGTWDVPGQEPIAAAANGAVRLSDGRYVTVSGDVFAQFLDADGDAIGARFQVNTTTQNIQQAPSVSALAGGRFVVAWTDFSPTGPIEYDPINGITFVSDVRAQILNPDGSKFGAEFLINNNTNWSQHNSGTETLADGSFVAVWTDAPGSVAQVFTAAGARTGSQFRIASAGTGPDIAALPDGRFVAAWADYGRTLGDEHLTGIHAQIFNANGTKSGAEFLVNTSVIGGQVAPEITTFADGRFAIAWEGNEPGDPVVFSGSIAQGSTHVDLSYSYQHYSNEPSTPQGTGVFAQIFNADGSRAGGEIKVNNKIADYQFDARLVALDAGHLAVVWRDKNTGDFVANAPNYAQIFDLNAVASNDALHGTTGPDALAGSIGDDMYFVDNAGDVVTEYRDEGADRVLSSISYTLPAGTHVEKLSTANNFGADPINLTGNELPNAIYGNQGDNTLDGKAGSDSLTGLGGNDRIEGGEGPDKAFFGSARNEYEVRTFLADGVQQTVVAHQGGSGADGTDTLTRVETLRFADFTLIAPVQANHRSSIDGDRFDDVLFQHAGNGQILYARMVDGMFQEWRVDTAPLGGDLKAIATADVNPGATGGAETFVQQQSNGAIYYASHDTGATTWSVLSAGLGADWKLRAVANIVDDSSADGIAYDHADLTLEAVIQNQVTGKILYAEILDGEFRGWISPNDHLNSDWVVVGVGDLYGGPFGSLLIQNQVTGTTYAGALGYESGIYWEAITSSITPEWHVKAVADITGDGRAEIIFQQASTGTTYYTASDPDTGFSVPHWGVVTANVTPDWVVQGTADVDNDGFNDVLFQNSQTGTTYYANMGPAGFEGWGAVATNISSEWQVV